MLTDSSSLRLLSKVTGVLSHIATFSIMWVGSRNPDQYQNPGGLKSLERQMAQQLRELASLSKNLDLVGSQHSHSS